MMYVKAREFLLTPLKIPVFFLAEFSYGGTLEMISRLADKKTLYRSRYAKLNVYIVNFLPDTIKFSRRITVCKNTVIMPFYMEGLFFCGTFLLPQ